MNKDIGKKMEHIIRLLSTTSGADKSFMLVQYTAILLTSLTRKTSSKSSSSSLSPWASRLSALSNLLSDARTTYRLWDLISIVQWLRSLNALPPSGSKPIQIERLQVIAMLIYYPLEHIYFLGSKRILPISGRIIHKAALYSSRAWGIYTILHFFHLWEEYKLLVKEKRLIQNSQTMKSYELSRKSDTMVASSLRQMEERRAAVINGLVVNLAYVPLTLHWSLPNGLYASEAITGICGSIAALAQLRAGWKASAISH